MTRAYGNLLVLLASVLVVYLLCYGIARAQCDDCWEWRVCTYWPCASACTLDPEADPPEYWNNVTIKWYEKCVGDEPDPGDECQDDTWHYGVCTGNRYSDEDCYYYIGMYRVDSLGSIWTYDECP